MLILYQQVIHQR